MELYRVESLTFTYPGQSAPALRDVSLTLRAGEFVTLCGLSGSGKSTLLRQLKTALAPNGVRRGAVLFDGRPLSDVSPREQAERIGFVQQSPENQIVTDKVWHELAFGPESLGYDTPTIRRRVAEMAGFFGMESWFHRETASLSGGQKQLLNLAAVLTLQPDVLILDEPTAQLDPIAAADFLAALARVNRELGTTVLLSEQRLEEALPLSDRAVVLDGGAVLAPGAPRAGGAQLRTAGHELFRAMPAAMRVWAAVENDLPCPVSVREGRDWLADFAASHPLKSVPKRPLPAPSEETVVTVSDAWFRYTPDAPDVLRGLELFAIVMAQLEGEDKPQLVYESLNAKGSPLRVSDLVRNLLLTRVGKEEQRRLFELYWEPLETAFDELEERVMEQRKTPIGVPPQRRRAKVEGVVFDAALHAWATRHIPRANMRTRTDMYGAFKKHLTGKLDMPLERVLESISATCLDFAGRIDSTYATTHIEWVMGKPEGFGG